MWGTGSAKGNAKAVPRAGESQKSWLKTLPEEQGPKITLKQAQRAQRCGDGWMELSEVGVPGPAE